MSSTATRMGSPNDWVDYAASKGAIDVFTQGLAREVAEDGIRVNAVAPGLVHTELHARAGEPDRPARYLGQIPMKGSRANYILAAHPGAHLHRRRDRADLRWALAQKRCRGDRSLRHRLSVRSLATYPAAPRSHRDRQLGKHVCGR